MDESTYPTMQTLGNLFNEDRFQDFYDLSWDDDYPVGSPENPAKPEQGQFSNTPPTNYQFTKSEPLETGGYDWLELSFYGEWDEKAFLSIAATLDDAKAAAAESGSGFILEMGGQEVLVSPSGAKRGMYCSWVFEWQGMEIGIVNRSSYMANSYNIHLAIRSMACMELGGRVAYDMACDFIKSLGLKIRSNKISRVDVCVDMSGVSTHEIGQAYKDHKFVSRPRKRTYYEEGYVCTGFDRGSGKRIKIRVYDKVRELKDSVKNDLKREILIKKRWGGIVKEATRIEFQLRREAIKDFDIDSVEEFFKRASEVTKWLTTK